MTSLSVLHDERTGAVRASGCVCTPACLHCRRVFVGLPLSDADDAGIGGLTANQVGRRLKRLARHPHGHAPDSRPGRGSCNPCCHRPRSRREEDERAQLSRSGDAASVRKVRSIRVVPQSRALVTNRKQHDGLRADGMGVFTGLRQGIRAQVLPARGAP